MLILVSGAEGNTIYLYVLVSARPRSNTLYPADGWQMYAPRCSAHHGHYLTADGMQNAVPWIVGKLHDAPSLFRGLPGMAAWRLGRRGGAAAESRSGHSGNAHIMYYLNTFGAVKHVSIRVQRARPPGIEKISTSAGPA